MSSSGIAVGLKKGYPVQKRTVPTRPSQTKAVGLINSVYNLIYSFNFSICHLSNYSAFPSALLWSENLFLKSWECLLTRKDC